MSSIFCLLSKKEKSGKGFKCSRKHFPKTRRRWKPEKTRPIKQWWWGSSTRQEIFRKKISEKILVSFSIQQQTKSIIIDLYERNFPRKIEWINKIKIFYSSHHHNNNGLWKKWNKFTLNNNNIDNIHSHSHLMTQILLKILSHHHSLFTHTNVNSPSGIIIRQHEWQLKNKEYFFVCKISWHLFTVLLIIIFC